MTSGGTEDQLERPSKGGHTKWRSARVDIDTRGLYVGGQKTEYTSSEDNPPCWEHTWMRLGYCHLTFVRSLSACAKHGLRMVTFIFNKTELVQNELSRS
jgi:hypothetical protein